MNARTPITKHILTHARSKTLSRKREIQGRKQRNMSNESYVPCALAVLLVATLYAKSRHKRAQ